MRWGELLYAYGLGGAYSGYTLSNSPQHSAHAQSPLAFLKHFAACHLGAANVWWPHTSSASGALEIMYMWLKASADCAELSSDVVHCSWTCTMSALKSCTFSSPHN